MRLFADMDQPSRNIDVSLLKLMVSIVEGHPSDNVGEVALQFKGVLQDKTDGTLLTGHTRAAKALVAGYLTMDDIAQDIRLIVSDVLVELVEVGLLDMKLSVDEEGIGIGSGMNHSLQDSVVVTPFPKPIAFVDDDRQQQEYEECKFHLFSFQVTPSLVSLTSNPAAASSSRILSLVAQSLSALALARSSRTMSTTLPKASSLS